ncbi:hypothetical protein TNCV_1921451 [Trichonephila clavipes]|nr:hypothetical protein TNCV_1921451 [Trichonephila clavipes]
MRWFPRCIKFPVNRHLDWNEVALSPNMSLDLSIMSLDPSSMSLDPRVKTIFGKPLFHWICQEFHLWMTPVSIVALGWNENFLSDLKYLLVGNLKNFILFIHDCSQENFEGQLNRDPKHNVGV